MKKTLFAFVVFLICLNSVAVVFADISITESQNINNDIFVDNEKEIDDGIPDVTIDDVSDWADRKGFEIIGFLQRFVQPFAIIVFIGCAILALLGAFGNGRLISTGLLGMGISLITYAIVLYAPEIMDIFLKWVKS